MSAYSEKLKDPRWQKRRLKVMEYARWRCQLCGSKDKTLHCHHSYYSKGKSPWQYPEGAIICVCEPCHDWIHDKEKPDTDPPEPNLPAEVAAPSAPQQPDSEAGRLYQAILDRARADRRLISAWAEVGVAQTLDRDCDLMLLTVAFPPDQSFARDFLEGSHMPFMEEVASRISGCQVKLKLTISE